jgi:hypothetical protein
MTLKFMKADMFFSSADKRRFFDRQETIDKIGKFRTRILGTIGANVRIRIQNSLKRAKSPKPSKPGTPPRQRLPGDDGLRKITYNLTDDEQSVIVKVIKWNRPKQDYNVPAVHEFGGVVGKEQFRLSPKGDTKWMFEPENAAKYIGLQKAIRDFEKYSRKAAKRKKFGKTKPKTMDDFGLITMKRQAAYPKRSFMKSGAIKYAKSGHFKRHVAELLKGE